MDGPAVTFCLRAHFSSFADTLLVPNALALSVWALVETEFIPFEVEGFLLGVSSPFFSGDPFGDARGKWRVDFPNPLAMTVLAANADNLWIMDGLWQWQDGSILLRLSQTLGACVLHTPLEARTKEVRGAEHLSLPGARPPHHSEANTEEDPPGNHGEHP